MRKVIYFRIIKGYYLTHEGRARLKLSVCLEKLHLLLKRTAAGEYPEDVLDCLNHELDQMKDYAFSHERNHGRAHTINHLFAVSTLIEERMLGNNQLLLLEELDEFLAVNVV